MFPWVECAKVKILSAITAGRCGSDQREYRVGELLPNGEVRRGNGEPAEPEHVSARFGYVPDLLPVKFSEPQPYFPSEPIG
jgi:hypothetical protein